MCQIISRLSTKVLYRTFHCRGISSLLLPRCETGEYPSPDSEFSEAFMVDEKELSRMIRHISRRFNLHTISEPSQYFDRFINELGLPPNTRMQIDHLWSAIRPHPTWQGKSRWGCGCMIYKLLKNPTQPYTSGCMFISNISEVTLRGLLKMIDGLLRKIGEASQN